MTFRIGTWAGGSSPTFTPGAASDVTVAVTAADTVTTLAAKINAANAGVVATVFKDGTGERLLLRSKSTGADAGFRVQTADADGNNTDNAGLSRFAYDPQTAAFGMASSGISVQNGQDAKARINGMEVTSKTNTLTDNIPGVTITLTATTTTNYGAVNEAKAPVTMAVREDVTPAVKNVQDFVTAYNALATSLADMTKYDAATKTPSIFQGDSAVLGLQSILRNVLGSVSTGSTYQRLADVGIERQLNGTLTLNTTKLSAAANNGTELQKLFTANNGNNQTNGFAKKFSDLAAGVLGTGGSVVNKAKALQKNLDLNATEQTRVNDRAAAVEVRLRKQYSALDTKMASLTALNNYVAQQVATWNKSTS
jgi:flagellar hook-associated protein 2